MPSARELLEQADALMRRNRSPLMDDIPVLTDSVPEARPGRPARLRPAPPEARTEDAVPMLTESGPRAPAPPAAASPDPSPQKPPAVVDEGEPSDWLQLESGEPSVIGDAPDSIAMVPPFDHRVSEEIEVEAPAEIEASFDADVVEPVSRATPPSEPRSPVAYPPTRVEEVEPLPAPNAAWTLEGDTIIDELRGNDDLGAAAMDPHIEPMALEAADAAPLENAIEPERSAAERKADDDARWASVAEEIRMQVLQRIDLFTDTGLRDQLGARLQPIVDRASADLVATINQHVGELLRAYVAEAIEREIESWRRGN